MFRDRGANHLGGKVRVQILDALGGEGPAGARGDGRQLDKTLDRLTEQVQDHAHLRPHR